MGLLDQLFPKPAIENMTRGQQRDYDAVKAVAEKVAEVPLVGDLPLAAVDAACVLGLRSVAPATCQAVHDTIGELNAPPRGQSGSVVSKAR